MNIFNIDSPEEEFKQLLLKNLPPIIARKDVGKYLGSIVARQTLANADSSGKGPQGAYAIGRSIVYPTTSLIDWIIERRGVQHVKNNTSFL